MTCTHCGAAVPDDADRCPKCLRRSGVVGGEPEPRASVEAAPREVSSTTRMLRGILALVVTVAVIVGLAFAMRAFVP